MTGTQKQIVTYVMLMLITFAVGLTAGVSLHPQLFPPREDAVAETEAAHGEAEEHIDLTEEAVLNLGLRLEEVTLSRFQKSQSIPGEVIEIAGQSDLSVSAPVGGVIELVDVRSGEAVGKGQTLFSLRITDPALIAAQTKLLDLVAQLEIKRKEIQRLLPFADGGAVPTRRKRELEYETQQLDAARETTIQEIRALGLPDETLQAVLANRRLADRVRIQVPSFDLSAIRPADTTQPVSRDPQRRLNFSVAALHAHPGRTVAVGEDLCDLSYHGKLYIKGQAFESDLETITRLADEEASIIAEFGHQHHGEHKHLVTRNDLRVLHIDNHVDPDTQTFSFYLPLENDVVQDLINEGRTYRQWRFKPGQRVHLRIPLENLDETIKLPLEAVAIEGPNAVVFRQIPAAALALSRGHAHPHPHPHPHPGEDDAHADELVLEPVPVRLLDRDDTYAVIEPGRELDVGDVVAINNAYKLQLVLRMGAGGGQAHHGHEH